jgi:hypothetical protein
MNERRTNEVDGHHSEELLLLGALDFDSAGFTAARFDSDDLGSDDLASLDFESPDFASLDFAAPEDVESPEDFESDFDSPPLPLSEPDDEEAAPSPFDDVRATF